MKHMVFTLVVTLSYTEDISKTQRIPWWSDDQQQSEKSFSQDNLCCA